MLFRIAVCSLLTGFETLGNNYDGRGTEYAVYNIIQLLPLNSENSYGCCFLPTTVCSQKCEPVGIIHISLAFRLLPKDNWFLYIFFVKNE